MGHFSSCGMLNQKMDSFVRPDSPGMDEIGDILLPQDLVDEILKDMNVVGECGEAGMLGGGEEVGVREFCKLRNGKEMEVEGDDGEFPLGDSEVTGSEINRVASNEGVNMTSCRQDDSQMERVKSESVRKYHQCASSETDLKKEKRMFANRVSAAKSRARKQAQIETLELKVNTLVKENRLKQKSLQFLKDIPKDNIPRFQLRRTSSL